jgi:toxin ParE1/3/4
MSYEVIITLTALQEEEEAYLFYEGKSDGWGEDFLNEVEDALQIISENPTFFSYCDSTKILRDFVLTRFPFVIIYELTKDKIIVTNIHHTKKNRT